MKIFLLSFLAILVLLITSCKKADEYGQQPELESMQQGLKTSAALAYSLSVVMAAIQDQKLPDNVIYEKNSGLIYIKIDQNHPLLFNKNVGDILVAFKWTGRSGLMSVLFTKIDLPGTSIKLNGFYLVPFMKRAGDNHIYTMFEKQDIIIGNGSDTLLQMDGITDIMIDSKINKLNSERSDNAFAVVKQNIWFITIDQNLTLSNVYDDDITVTGGGQIVEVAGTTGGMIYHALIDARMNYSVCPLNPISGIALSQNFKFGGEPYIDLGSSLLSFRNACDGKLHVDLSTGKYLKYNNKDISLNLN